MLHVRILVPPDLTSAILAALDGSVGVANVCVARGVGRGPLGGDVIELDAAREDVDGLLDDLDRFDIERVGSIAIEQIDLSLSQAAKDAAAAAPGNATDAAVRPLTTPH